MTPPAAAGRSRGKGLKSSHRHAWRLAALMLLALAVGAVAGAAPGNRSPKRSALAPARRPLSQPRRGTASPQTSSDLRPDLVWLRGGNAFPITGVAYSPDGALAASASGG